MGDKDPEIKPERIKIGKRRYICTVIRIKNSAIIIGKLRIYSNSRREKNIRKHDLS